MRPTWQRVRTIGAALVGLGLLLPVVVLLLAVALPLHWGSAQQMPRQQT